MATVKERSLEITKSLEMLVENVVSLHSHKKQNQKSLNINFRLNCSLFFKTDD